MDEGEIKMKTKIGNLHEELIIKDEPINQSSVLPSTENSNIPSKKVQIKAKVEKSNLQRNRQKWACSVPQCSNKLTNRIFGYPSNAKQKERWLQALKVDKCKSSDKVCYLHFKEKDFGKRNLNYGVVPSQNLPQELKGEKKSVRPLDVKSTENEPDNSKAIESNETHSEENNRALLNLPDIHSNSLPAGKQNLKKYYEIPHKEVHIKKESIDQGLILSSTKNTNFMNSSICPTIKQEIPETYDESKTFNKLEKIEELGIFVKSETDIKPEIIFGISESKSECVMQSTVNSDPLDITDHEDFFSKKDSMDKNCHAILELEKPFSNVHEKIINQPNSLEKCKFCPEFVKNTYMDEHIALLHTIKCHFCPKYFAKGAEMNAHVSSVHAFKCQFCPAIFLSYKDKEQHITVHEEKKRFFKEKQKRAQITKNTGMLPEVELNQKGLTALHTVSFD